jgi:hypothetical protein
MDDTSDPNASTPAIADAGTDRRLTWCGAAIGSGRVRRTQRGHGWIGGG